MMADTYASGCEDDAKRLDDLLAAIAELEDLIEERESSGDFNIFEVIGIVNAEIRHSNAIAWLMDPHGGHGLGGRVLAGLIEHAGGKALGDMSGFAVRRETDHIDILASSEADRIALAIENKVWSGEHDDQLGRYRRCVEKRFPGWEHLYLYLTPNDDSPEAEEDARVWTTLGYGDLAAIVDEAMRDADPSEKARMLIGDYLECIRRHIVHDDELSERCVEIYANHKQAIDLILANLPDTSKTVHDHAREWARRLGGAYVVEGCSGGKGYVRFRTEAVDELFPPLEMSDSWRQNSFWFYEIITKNTADGLGCDLKLQLCFNNPRKVEIPAERLEGAADFIESFAGGDAGTFSITSYSGYYTKNVRFDAGTAGYQSVAEVCDSLWEDFLKRQERAVERAAAIGS